MLLSLGVDYENYVSVIDDTLKTDLDYDFLKIDNPP